MATNIEAAENTIIKARETDVGRVSAGDTVEFDWKPTDTIKIGVVTDFWTSPDGPGASVLVQSDDDPHGRTHDIAVEWLTGAFGDSRDTTTEYETVSAADGTVLHYLYVEIPSMDVVRATTRAVRYDPEMGRWRTRSGVSRTIRLDDDGAVADVGWLRDDVEPYVGESWRTMMADQIENQQTPYYPRRV